MNQKLFAIDQICCGQYSSSRCGGHIHIGADYLTTEHSWDNLKEIIKNTEKILYIISNKAGEIPRDGIFEYAKPSLGDFEELHNRETLNLESEEDLKKLSWKIHEDKFYGINFKNVGERRNTIEFRYPNGPKDSKTWIENINLFGGIVKASEDLAMIQAKPEEQRTNEEKDLLIEIQILKDKNSSDEEKLDALLEIIMPNEKDRYIYRNRYYENKRLIDLDTEFKEQFLEYFEEDKISSDEITNAVFGGKDRVTKDEYDKYDAGVYWLDNDDKSLW